MTGHVTITAALEAARDRIRHMQEATCDEARRRREAPPTPGGPQPFGRARENLCREWAQLANRLRRNLAGQDTLGVGGGNAASLRQRLNQIEQQMANAGCGTRTVEPIVLDGSIF